MTFRTALLVSTIVHSAAFLPLQRTAIPKKMAEEKKPIVVDYVKIKEPEEVDAAVATAKMAEPPKAIETPKIDLSPRVEVKPAVSAVKSEAAIKSSEDYINYYQLIREKIRQALKRNYTNYYDEGDVAVTFVLNSDGSLASAEASPAGTALTGIAQRSVREAAPFPAFPKALTSSKTPFDLVISFRKK